MMLKNQGQLKNSKHLKAGFVIKTGNDQPSKKVLY